MPEREYFSFRYAIPGYTFILLVIAINYVPLLTILEKTQAESAFGAFLAFLSLFTGSAIGFLISQFWWWKFGVQPLLGKKQLEPAAREIYKKYFKKDRERAEEITKGIRDNIKAIGYVFEYIIRRDEDDKFFDVASRRWDMYHVFSSTILALIVGAVVGLLCRFYCEIFLFGASFSIVQGNAKAMAEAIALLLVFAGWGLLLWVLAIQKQRLLADYCPLLKAIILKSKVTKEELEEVFPEELSERKKERGG